MTYKSTEIRCRENGFSAIEMLIAVALLMVVLGVVVKGMTDMQKRSFSESTDSAANGAVNAAVRMNANIACGVVFYSPTNVIYEGDLDGSGTVSVVFLNLVAGAGGACPCTLQRGVVQKAIWVGNPAVVPQYFTTVNGVLNSGNGAGGSTFPLVVNGPGNYTSYKNADVFDAYDANAFIIAAQCSLGIPGNPGTVPDCSQIRSLQITVNVAPAYADPTSKQYPVYSITSKARINF
jgi:hypothetical protein